MLPDVRCAFSDSQWRLMSCAACASEIAAKSTEPIWSKHWRAPRPHGAISTAQQRDFEIGLRDFEIGIGTEVGFAHWREVENAFLGCAPGL